MTELIAEFCQNHNGDFDLLTEMIHAASESGARFGKMQTIFADDLTQRERFESGIIENGVVKAIKRPYQSEYARLKKLEIGYEQHERFIDECHRYNLKAMTTCFTREAVEPLSQFGWDAIKVASYDCSSLPLLRDLSQYFDNIIISTGATYDEEVETAVELLNTLDTEYALLHCVTIYPTPLKSTNLRRMHYLKALCSQVGFSDHSLVSRDGLTATLAAIYEGACYIERHFTLLAANESKDGPVSVRPEHFAELAEFSKLSKSDQLDYLNEKVPDWHQCLGEEFYPLSNTEILNRDYYRGRFATHNNNKIIYNWEEGSL